MVSLDLCRRIKEHSKPMGVKLLFCCGLYSLIMAYDLVNCADGLWNGPYYIAGDWELSLGRWLIKYWDGLLLGIHINPWTTIITLLLFILGTELLVDILGFICGSWQDYLVSMLFLSNVIICISVSYLYTSGIYGLSFFLGMVCVECVLYNKKKGNVWALWAGAMCLAMVMGLYQAYLGCITLTALLYLILMFHEGCGYEKIWRYLVRGSIVGIAGFCLYEAALHLNLSFFHVGMSAYNGADDISVRTILESLVPSVKRAYVTFWEYLIGGNHKWSVFSPKMLKIILMLAVAGVIGTGIAPVFRPCSKSRPRSYILCWCACIALLPLAAGITFILAPKSAFLGQQTAPMALLVSLLFALLLKAEPCKWMIGKNAVTVALALMILYGNVGQTLISEEAMREGTIASESIAESVLQTLIESGRYDGNAVYALAGAPCGSPLFSVTPLYEKANGHAYVGGPWWDGSELDNRSWYGIFHFRLGVRLPMCDSGRYEQLMKTDIVRDMPLYPAEGSIQEVDGVIVIKVSER